MKKMRFLSGTALKYIALLSMLCDHVNKAILIGLISNGSAAPIVIHLSTAFHILGRLALPIFAFLLVEGFFHTRSRVKYGCNLLLFAIVSEIPFNMFTGGKFFIDWHQNIYFTLALGFGMIWLIDILRQKTRSWPWLSIPIIAAACLIAMFGSFDYDLFGILTIATLYLFRGMWLCPVLSFLPLVKTPWAGFGYLSLYLYNGERGRQCKWFNYWFYPVHLLILGGIRMLLCI